MKIRFPFRMTDFELLEIAEKTQEELYIVTGELRALEAWIEDPIFFAILTNAIVVHYITLGTPERHDGTFTEEDIEGAWNRFEKDFGKSGKDLYGRLQEAIKNKK